MILVFVYDLAVSVGSSLFIARNIYDLELCRDRNNQLQEFIPINYLELLGLTLWSLIKS